MLRNAATVLAVVVLAAVAAFAFISGKFVRWSDAYQALESAETSHPVFSREAERVLLANAMVESEPPRGMPTDKRLHPVGTLAHLRYETLKPDGTVAASTEVRALVPSLPYFGVDAPGAPFGRTACPQRCQDGLAASGAVEIARSG